MKSPLELEASTNATVLRRQAAEQRGEVGGRQVGPWQVESGLVVLRAAVSQQEDQHVVPGMRAGRDGLDGLGDAFASGAAVDGVGIEVGVLGEICHHRVGNPHPSGGRGAQGHRQRVKRGLEARLATGPGDDEHERAWRLLGNGRAGGPPQQQRYSRERHRAPSFSRTLHHSYAIPRRRRYSHSDAATPMSTRNRIGISHRSLRSTTVAPLALYTMSSATCEAPAAG